VPVILSVSQIIQIQGRCLDQYELFWVTHWEVIVSAVIRLNVYIDMLFTRHVSCSIWFQGGCFCL